MKIINSQSLKDAIQDKLICDTECETDVVYNNALAEVLAVIRNLEIDFNHIKEALK